MHKHKLKIVADIDLPFVREYFGEEGDLVLKPGRLIERADLLDADLLFVRSLTRVDENLLQGTAVKLVGTVTTGLDHLDLAWLEKAGILWRSAAGYNAEPVADYVIAVVAALQKQHLLPPSSLRIGLVGVGQVGGRVAERCKKLAYKVTLCDPPRAEQEKNFSSTALADFKNLDLLSLHTPLLYSGSHPTYHLIDSAFLQKERGPCVLLNTSRGAVVDFSSLEGQSPPWLYCFDVFEGEPAINLNSLQSAFIATPHLAGYSLEARYRGIEMIYRACCELQLFQAKIKAFPALPRNKLSFEGRELSWQEVVLSIFNPLLATQAMKQTLLTKNVLLNGAGKCATLFDELRQQYIGDRIQRHELSSTVVSRLRLKEEDRHIVEQLGITIEE